MPSPLRRPHRSVTLLAVAWLLPGLWAASGCNNRSPGKALGNYPPVPVAGPDREVLVGAPVLLDGSASSDIDGDPLTYAWRQTEGGFINLSSGTAATASPLASFDAPASPTLLAFELTVSDGEASATDTLRIHVVSAIGNEPPVAIAGDDRTVESGFQVVLDGGASADPDWDRITFLWAQVGGPAVTLTGADTAQSYFGAPEVDEMTPLIFSLTVSDGVLESAPDTVTIIVVPATTSANAPPVAEAGAPLSVDMLASFTLDGSRSADPEGRELTYRWQEVGTAHVSFWDRSVASPTLTAPAVTADTDLVFALVVNDGAQDSIPDTVVVSVRHHNRPPVITAVEPPAPYLVDEGQTLTITVVLNDPDGDVVTWTDNCGYYAFAMCVADGNMMTVTLAPGFDASSSTPLITLHADDGEGGTVDVPLPITINDINRPPTVSLSHTPPINMVQGNTRNITATFSDPDADALTFDLTACSPVPWLTCTSSSLGRVVVTAAPPLSGSVGQQTATIGASDGRGGTLSVPLVFNVADRAPPVVTFTGLSNPPSNHIANAGLENIAVSVSVTENGDTDAPYACSITAGPTWVTIDDTSKQLSITPPVDARSALVTVRCVDADGNSGSGSFTVWVDHAPTAAFTWSPEHPAPGTTVALSDTSTDPDGGADTHTCQWSCPTATLVGDVTSCSGVSFIATTCAATYSVTLAITDAHGLTSSVSHDITAQPYGPHVYKRSDCSGACGSATSPWCTLQSALAQAEPGTYTDIYVAAAQTGLSYNDTAADGGAIVMKTGVSLHGGYSNSAWSTLPNRDANKTIVVTTLPAGISFNGVTDVIFEGFTVQSQPAITGAGSVKANLTLADVDQTVAIQNNVIDARAVATGSPSDTIAIDMKGSVAAVIRNNLVHGGDGLATATAIRLQAGGLFDGTIQSHRAGAGNGIAGGTGVDTAGLRLLGPVGANAVIADNEIQGGSGTTQSTGIFFGGMVSVSEWDASMINGGSGALSIGVDFAGIGVGNSVLVSGATGIGGGTGTKAIGLRIAGAGDLTISGCSITGGTPGSTKPQEAIGVRLGESLNGAGLGVTLSGSSIDGGASSVRSIGVSSEQLGELNVDGGNITGTHTDAGVEGIGIAIAGGHAAIDGASVLGLQRLTTGGAWVGTGFGIKATDDAELTLTRSIVMGGEANEATGVSYTLEAAAPALAIGGPDAGGANRISGAMLDGIGQPKVGGRTLIGIAIATQAGAFSGLARITNNSDILGGAPSPGATGMAPLAAGIAIDSVGTILIQGNARIQGCLPSCGGIGPMDNSIPYGAGIAIAGAAVLDDPATTGGIIGNSLIQGGPIATGATYQPRTTGIWLHRLAGLPGRPRVLVRGNTIYGNSSAASAVGATEYADGINAHGATLLLGDGVVGNSLVAGGFARGQSTGVLVSSTTLGGQSSAVIRGNTRIVGSSAESDGVGRQAYGILVQGEMVTDVTIIDNQEIWGGSASESVAGISLDNVKLGPVARNAIVAGWIAPAPTGTVMPRTTGLDLNGVAGSGGFVIEKNLIEGCGIYDQTRTNHSPVCGNATVSTGAWLQASGSFSFWNNRVFGGYAAYGDVPPRGAHAVGVELAQGSGSGSSGQSLVAHNFICGQGTATKSAAALHVLAVDSMASGQDSFVVNNILDSGGTSATRRHVLEYAASDLTALVFMGNLFVPDTSPVFYEEDRGSSTMLFGDGQIAKDCTAIKCLDGDLSNVKPAATSQQVGGRANYEGDVIADPQFAGTLASIREVPRTLPLTAFNVQNGAVIKDKGYNWTGADPYSLEGPGDDFEGAVRTVPDIGHDEMP